MSEVVYNDSINEEGGKAPNVVVHLRHVGDYIRGFTAFSNHIVNTRLLGHVFTHHVHHIVHGFNTIQC